MSTMKRTRSLSFTENDDRIKDGDNGLRSVNEDDKTKKKKKEKHKAKKKRKKSKNGKDSMVEAGELSISNITSIASNNVKIDTTNASDELTREELKTIKRTMKEKRRDKEKKNKEKKRIGSAVQQEILHDVEIMSEKNENNKIDELASESSTTVVSTSDSSDCICSTDSIIDKSGITLLLFYQYVQPQPWTKTQFRSAVKFVREAAQSLTVTGRMRVSIEGLNCTLTGSYDNIRAWCSKLRKFGSYFESTEFKLTDNLPDKQRFPKLNVFEVAELVTYGLNPTIVAQAFQNTGGTATHLEPQEYHEKLLEDNTVVIDVRNQYESDIGHFDPIEASKNEKINIAGGAQMLNPKMRKSTEFPVWLDKPETKAQLKGKQVLMYCTGGVRCERASALLRHKMQTEEDVKDLDIKGVYQLQGGIDKYFKAFPNGGCWKGKNYTFDKRFAHAPTNKTGNKAEASENDGLKDSLSPISKCASCSKPEDKYRGKFRCPTCSVPLLICSTCRDTMKQNNNSKLVRCSLCIEENITHKRQIKQREDKEKKIVEDMHKKLFRSTVNKASAGDKGTSTSPSSDILLETVTNPENITRLYIGNLLISKIQNAKAITQIIPNITHLQFIKKHNQDAYQNFCFCEVSHHKDATHAVEECNGTLLFGRPVKIRLAKPDGKSRWPPPNSNV